LGKGAFGSMTDLEAGAGASKDDNIGRVPDDRRPT
jgi:hypothetical protein